MDQFVGGQAKPLGNEPGGPFADAVERLAGHQEVFDQQEESTGGGDLGAGVLAGQAVAEELLKTEPLEDPFEDRQGAQPIGVEGESPCPGDLARPALGCCVVGPRAVILAHRC